MNFKTKKFGLRKSLADFLLWSGIIIGVIALVTNFFVAIFSFKLTNGLPNPNNLWIPNTAWYGLWLTVSDFSLQANLILFFFFCMVLVNRFNSNRARLVNGPFSMAVTIYMTITCVIFFTVLFKDEVKNLNTKDPTNVIMFANTFLLHLVLPIIIIYYYLLTAGKTFWKFKTMAIIHGPIIMSYMLVYLAYALLKGTFVGQIKNQIITYSYPYDFLNFKNNLGEFFIFFFIISFCVIGLIGLYTFYNNCRYKIRRPVILTAIND